MCGIAGWVDFHRPRAHERAVLEKMTTTMAPRGPDAAGTWLGEYVGLGHRRLSIIDVAGGTQPMTAGDASAPHAVLSYSGEIYNFREIRDHLRARGYVFRSRSDTEVVLLSYLEWGTNLVDRLNGMFAFAVWDAHEQRLVLVRDRLGIKPLYYAEHEGGVLFGSEPKAVLAHPEFTKTADREGLADLLALVKTPGKTPLRGLRELPPGHVLTVDRTGSRLHRYWSLQSQPHTEDTPATSARVRELLTDIVRRQLITDVPMCTLLSGGLDSSALTGIAARELASHGEGPVRSFSVDFSGNNRDFRSSEFRPERDNPYAVLAAEHIGTNHRTIELPPEVLTDDAARRAVLEAHDLPLTFGDVDTSLHCLFSRIRDHSTVALSGESADEVFGGYGWFHDPAVVAGSEFPWLSRMRLIEPDLLTRQFRAETQFDDYVADAYRTALGEVTPLDSEDAAERRMRELSYLHLTRWLQILLDRKDRLSMAAGLEVRVPFCDHRLVEYVYNIPWKIKTFDGKEKSVLRDAVSDLVPSGILHRKKSPYPTTANLAYERDLRSRTTALLRDKDSPAWEIVDRDGIRRLLDRPVGHFDSQLSRNPFETTLLLNQWLR
ncbi:MULTISPECIES: asparagine synthase (glutamine-hydrolyzing) [unclassified Actinopolyspora]|uniref:asparagine synthase (glutamine-hydrolyzing) n=1 Tax=unclassified Actinopolyspora TaxID=2639451 RepID=UPI0013F5C33D|nr:MULTISPECIES: asparagine synthase (glutamine-hydrolyzing) [unclassified Actinopolyspora]NHD19433.1 asparagine synthase (glutamine-hydrolyzing) [Actinopolyspora sp. BKK2]NHE78494.1 asparagine synthase (glutamine-hydrolyzing) [Actinopolyspora sp. BKK1]